MRLQKQIISFSFCFSTHLDHLIPFLPNQCLQLTDISVNENGIALQDIPCRKITKQHNMLCCSKGWCDAFWQIQDSSNIHNFILINSSMNAIKEKQKTVQNTNQIIDRLCISISNSFTINHCSIYSMFSSLQCNSKS